jgi:branched-chain amino acid transport system permease protein
MTRGAAALVLLAILVVACSLPVLVSDYRTFQLTLALVYAIAILGLNILTGYNGQFSLGMARSTRSVPMSRRS